MENKVIARKFKLLGQLMELHRENLFKVRAINNAAFKLDKLSFKIVENTEETLSAQQGIGKSTASKVWELIRSGAIPELDKLLNQTPEGILEMLTIKGIGPKKIVIIWHTLGIETLGELYYACNENRLIEAKGFGLKTQEEIKKAIDFNMASEGYFLYSQAEKLAEDIQAQVMKLLPANTPFSCTGDFRRKTTILRTVDYLIGSEEVDTLYAKISRIPHLIQFEHQDELIQTIHESGLPINFLLCPQTHFQQHLLFTTGNDAHLRQLGIAKPTVLHNAASEKAIYEHYGLDYIAPELREGNNEIQLAREKRLPELIEYRDIKGALHNHSTWSDGVHSLKEMAFFCRDVLGLNYLGITDHSRAAVYAKGLTIDQVYEQWEEIERLNQLLAPFKIFKGIESDILSDGSLDYPDEVLSGFDFVVASIHSNLKMDEEKATTRLIKAIENPYTTILGHPTGRLLLSRKGYPLNFRKVIDACAANAVVVEINANPLRLDLDWRWHQYALEKNVMLSINPDAHRNEGFSDMQYGVLVGRKGGLTAKECLNCMDRAQIQHYFSNSKP